MTEDADKTKEQLVEELDGLRRRTNELVWAEDELQRINAAFKQGVDALNMVLMNSQDILAILRPDGNIAYVEPLGAKDHRVPQRGTERGQWL